MISFGVKGVRVELLFGFFVIVAIASLGRSNQMLITLLCCVAHEAGHLIAMLLLKQKPNAIVAYGGGIKIKAPLLRVSRKGELVIYLCGPIVNLLLFLLCVLTNQGGSVFSLANMSLCLFNLLPVKHLDGGKIASILADKNEVWYNTVELLRKLIVLLFSAFASVSLLKGNISITLVIALAYLLLSEYMD